MNKKHLFKTLACVGAIAAAGLAAYNPSPAQANGFSFGDNSWNGGWSGSTHSISDSIGNEPTVDLDVRKRAPRATYEVPFEEGYIDNTLKVKLLQSWQDYVVAWQLGYWSPTQLRKDVRRALGLARDTPVFMRVQTKDGVKGYSFSGPGEALFKDGRWLYADEIPYTE